MSAPESSLLISCTAPQISREEAVATAAGHAFTVDLEDWAHGLLGGDTPITDRVVANVDRLLDLLQSCGVRATFFALGKVCARHPAILPRVAAAGHEIASHGYGHESVYRLTPQRFRDDVRSSVDVIGAQTGKAPVGYRAPQFSVTLDTLWFPEILEELGFRYSSSVFPIAGSRYGIPQAPAHPFCWGAWPRRMPGRNGAERISPPDGCRLMEFPLSTLRLVGRRWPASGGGYLRLLPAVVVHQVIRQCGRAGWPAALYMHPYELDRREVTELRRGGLRVSAWVAFKQALFRSRVETRLRYLFAHHRFRPMREVLGC